MFIQRLNGLLFPVIRAYHGVVIKTIGDSIMASFESPQDALWAAVSMQRRLDARNRQAPRNERRFEIRVVANYGRGIVEERDIYGDVVNVAGKLIAACAPREILVTEELCRAVGTIREVGFLPSPAVPGAAGTQVYRVEWQPASADTAADAGCMVAVAWSGPGLAAGIKRIASRARSVVWQEPGMLLAVYDTVPHAIRTLHGEITALRSGGADSGVPAVLFGGLEIAAAGRPARQDFEALRKTMHRAAPFDLIVSRAVFDALDPAARSHCQQFAFAPGDWYVYGEARDPQSLFASALPAARDSGQQPCLYCGSHRHAPDACPSKRIESPTGFLDALAYESPDEIEQRFTRHYDAIVAPLGTGAADRRCETAIRQDRSDAFTQCFLGFYEVTMCLQLRTLRLLYDCPQQRDKSSGALHMGADCLRVSRHDEARVWFEKAADAQPDDPRPQLALAVVDADVGNSAAALARLERQRDRVAEPGPAAVLHLFMARLHELAGDLDEAQKCVRVAARLRPEWRDLEWYQGCLLARAGKIPRAYQVFSRLLRQTPRYFLALLVGAEVSRLLPDLPQFLRTEYFRLRQEATQGLNRMRRVIEQERAQISPDDRDLQQALELYRSAVAVFRKDSVAGLMDVPGLAVSVDNLVQRSVRNRSGLLAGELHRCRSGLHRFTRLLDRFPYRWLIRETDRRARRQCQAALDAAEALGNGVLPGMEKLQSVIEPMSRSTQLVHNRHARLLQRGRFVAGLECALKALGVGLTVTLLTTCVMAGILSLYHGYEYSFRSLTAMQGQKFISFGWLAGLVGGSLAAGLWLMARARSLFARVR